MIFSDNQTLLNDLNIIIAYTWETCASTSWYEGMINMKSFGVEDIITAENGEEMRPTKTGDLPVIQYDQYDQEVQSLVLQSETVSPHG